MPNQASQTFAETISKFDALFAVRTGLTVMLPCLTMLKGNEKASVTFIVSPDNPRDIIITAAGKKSLLKGLQKPHLDASVERGFIMLYETEDDEVVRCTPCNYQKA
jgi:hypothetical protein